MSFSKFFGLWHFDQAFVELLPKSAQACGGGTGSGLGCLMLERLALPSEQDAESFLLYHGSGFRCSTEAPFRGLWEEEQDLLHGLVLPSGCHGRCRALQHCAWVLIQLFGVYGLVTKPPSGLVYLCMALPVATLTKVLCVHSLLEHTDVTIMYDNEALYDICRRSLVHPCH